MPPSPPSQGLQSTSSSVSPTSYLPTLTQSPQITNRICVLCQNIFNNFHLALASWPKPALFPHYDSVLSLEESAENGCNLCKMFLKSFESENNKGGTSYQCFRLRKEFEMKQRIGLEKEMDCDERKRYALTVVLRPNDPSLPVEEDPLIQDWSVVACVPAPKGSKPPWENIQEQVELKKVKKGWQADGIVRGFFAKSPVPLPLRLEDEDDDAMKARYEQIISLAQGWMHSCLMTHKKCNLATSKTTPSRLLYIGNDKVRLWERPRNSTTSLIYSTLSHCWGDTLLLKLQKHNISEFSKEIPDSKLCKTFLDAISIARKLHIDYIWIDALCIIQDENDWQKEAGLMSDVYKFSHMNITALSAHNGTEGCFFPPSSDNAIFNHQVSAKLSPDSDETALFNLIDRDLYGNAISSEPLAKRAWIYQERALAPRVLYLGREMVYFECEEQDYCEAWLDGIPHSALLWSTLRAKSRGVWTRGWSLVVETYSRCQMTFEHDKLVALSGVAKALQEETGDEYLAGMWRKEISLQIDWRPDRSFGGNIKRPLVYRAPSWSWASVDGPVRIRGGARPGERVCIQVLHARIVPKGANIFGEVSGGILRLGCDYLCRVSRKEDNWFLETGSTELWTRDKGWVTWDDDDLYDACPSNCFLLPTGEKTDETRRGKFLYCPLLRGIVLEPTNVKGEYRRIGSFVLFESQYK